MQSRERLEQLAQSLNELGHIEDARVVEFLGKPHVHVDLADGDIAIGTQEGETRYIAVSQGDNQN